MVATISFNPFVTTNAAGSFSVRSNGYVQGTAQDDPAIRYKLAGGVLAQSETLPAWGGMGISELIPGDGPTGPNKALGGVIGRATNVTAGAIGSLTGFTVFDQNYSAVQTPQSPVPLVGSGATLMFYRLGSGARIAVAVDPSLADVEGDIITTAVSWDSARQMLVPFAAAEPAETITGITWANGIATVTTSAAHGYVAGDDVTLSGQVPSGYSGTQTILTVPTTTTFTYVLAVNPGTETTPGTIAAGGGALPVRVLSLEIGNSMTVSYDPVTGFATWNRSGSTALILI
jgi:hypothetical protein